MAKTTDWYIQKISDLSNPFGDKLIKLLDETHKQSLIEVTLDEAKEFYEQLTKMSNDE